MITIVTKSYSAPPINKKEILRYAGGNSSESTLQLLDECINEAYDILKYKVCYCLLPVITTEDLCDFGAFSVKSHKLATNLSNCTQVILMAATVGIELDRLITKYSRISPSKALMLQAFGAERIETLCDQFCADIKNTLNLPIKARFSAGYGDLPLDTQKSIFALINPQKHIGLTLNDSMLMSPSKSVTAFIGIKEV